MSKQTNYTRFISMSELRLNTLWRRLEATKIQLGKATVAEDIAKDRALHAEYVRRQWVDAYNEAAEAYGAEMHGRIINKEEKV